MATFYASKCDGILTGVTEDDCEKISEIGLDTVVKCKATRNRNYKNLKRFFAFVKIAFEMQNHFDDKDIFRNYITMGAGYFKSAVTPKGITIFIPISISFDNLEEEEFKILFKKALNYYMIELSKARTVTNDEFLSLLDFD